MFIIGKKERKERPTKEETKMVTFTHPFYDIKGKKEIEEDEHTQE